MAGLAKICKSSGSMRVNGILYVWDHVKDKAVPEVEMPVGSERWKESERLRWSKIKESINDTKE